jgi:Domain of Unknown Function (DUF1080)
MRFLPPLLACLLVASAPPDEVETGFVPMFDGKTLDGWKQVGGKANYRVDGDEIVGTVDPAMKGNSFLWTEKTYGDFILKLDLKLDIPGNSGIQFRSHERVEKDGSTRVFGYQAEVDPSARAWSGGLYDEARRAWLQDLKDRPEARKAFQLKGWNTYEIEARGPHLTIKLNGIPCSDYLDTADLEGFIALQVHAGKEGMIRWKNVRIKDLGRSSWKPLFDGKTLQGWEPKGGGSWTVEGGAILGTNAASEPRHGHLFSKEEFGDFAVRLKFESKLGNSGLYFRVDESGSLGVRGFQAEIDPSRDIGGLYETEGRGWVVQPKPEDVKKWVKPAGWNELSVVALGGRVVVAINGFKSAEILDPQGRKRGKLALQLHGGQDVDVRFKDIEVLELDRQGGK